MAKVVTISFVDNSDKVLQVADEKVNAWLKAIGSDAAQTAAKKAPVDTGRLKNSINWATKNEHGSGDLPQATPEDKSVYIGTNVNYAIYHEYGTGLYGGITGRKTPWYFKGRDGKWHKTVGVPAKHYFQFGMTAHAMEYKSLLEQALKQ